MQREVIGSARANHAGMSSAKATMRSRHSSAIVRKLEITVVIHARNVNLTDGRLELRKTPFVASDERRGGMERFSSRRRRSTRMTFSSTEAVAT